MGASRHHEVSEQDAERSSSRPILVGAPERARAFRPTGGGSAAVTTPGPGRQAARLHARVTGLLDAFGSGAVTVDDALPVGDPELVVVFEVIDSQRDVITAAEALRIEILVEVEDEVSPDDDFPRIRQDGSPSGSTVPVVSCLHAMCASREAATELVALWNRWIADGRLGQPYGGLADLFAHLRDVRPWGPADRLRVQGVAERLDGMLDDQQIPIEIELWFRNSRDTRAEARQRVADLVAAAGGTVLRDVVLPQIRYHGLAIQLPVPAVRHLVARRYDDVALVKAPDVLYLRTAGQIVDDPSDDVVEHPGSALESHPSGDPVICLLDGVPLANHDLLGGRVNVWDPDDLAARPLSTAANLRHGTAMASVLVWGDLSAGEFPMARPLLVRPILTPSTATDPPIEELPEGALAPDLTWRVFRELFEGVDGEPPVAPNAVIVNLSVGDQAMPFDVLPSAWARAVDWLSHQYGALVVVSAGNHRALPVPGISAVDLEALGGEERRTAIRTAMYDQAGSRRLLSPAESLNALTVGAIHHDEAGKVPIGYRIDPGDGADMVHPLGALGRGQRRAVKPDLATPGGRSYLVTHPGAGNTLRWMPSPLGPGIKVAASSGSRTTNGATFVAGTSPAAALVSRRAGQIHDLLESLEGWPRSASRSQRAVAIKALLAHGASWPDLRCEPLAPERVWGYGTVARDLTRGCSENEATVIFLGQLQANQEQRLVIPLPAGLQQVGIKQVTATLAWLSPINPSHRQYRRAKLSFSKPQGLVPADDLKNQGIDHHVAQRGTVQQQTYETTRASTADRGKPFILTIKCVEQAGGLGGRSVDYAVALSLWVAPELGVDVYEQVRTDLRAVTRIQPRPS